MTHFSAPEPEPVPIPEEASDPAAQAWGRIPRRTLTIALSVLPVVALANVGVLVWSLGGIDLSERITQPWLLLLAASLVFVPMLASSLRMAIWARFLGVPLGFGGALKVVTGTMVASSVTPLATGSTPFKVLFLMGEGVGSRRALTLTSFSAAEDTLAMFSLVGVCAGFTGFALFEFLGRDPVLMTRYIESVQTLGIVIAVVLGIMVLLSLLVAGGVLGRRVREFAVRLGRWVRDHLTHIVSDWGAVLQRGKAIALLNLSLAWVQYIVRFSIAGLVLAAFGVDWHPAIYWLLQYLVQSVSSIVPTPGGVGGAEAAFLLMFAPFVEIAIRVPAMSTWRLLFFYLPLAGAALIFFLQTRSLRRQRAALPPVTNAAIHPAE